MAGTDDDTIVVLPDDQRPDDAVFHVRSPQVPIGCVPICRHAGQTVLQVLYR